MEKDIARRFFEEVWNEGQLEKMDEMTSDDIVIHVGGEQDMTGRASMMEFIEEYRKAFPDIHFTVHDQVREGDKVFDRWTATGTHRGELMGIPATGRNIEITGMGMTRFEDGKIVERWGNPDRLSLMKQLGVIPDK